MFFCSSLFTHRIPALEANKVPSIEKQDEPTKVVKRGTAVPTSSAHTYGKIVVTSFIFSKTKKERVRTTVSSNVNQASKDDSEKVEPDVRGYKILV